MTASKATTRAAPSKQNHSSSSSKLVTSKDKDNATTPSKSHPTKPPRHTPPPTAAAITAQLLQQKYAQELAKVLKSQYPEWLQLLEKQVKQQQAAKAAAAAAADKPVETSPDKVDVVEKKESSTPVDDSKPEPTEQKTITPLKAKSPAPKRTRKNSTVDDSSPTRRKRKPRTPKPKQDVEKTTETLANSDIQSSLLFSDLDPAVLQTPSPSSHHLAHAAAAIRIQSIIDAQVPRTLRRDCFFSLPLNYNSPKELQDVDPEDSSSSSPPVTPQRSISPSLVSDTGSSDDHLDVDDDFDALAPLGGFLDEHVDLTTEILSPYSLDDDEAIQPIQAPIVKSQSDALYPLAATPFELDTTLFEPVVVSLETVSPKKRPSDDITKTPTKRVRVVAPDEE